MKYDRQIFELRKMILNGNLDLHKRMNNVENNKYRAIVKSLCFPFLPIGHFRALPFSSRVKHLPSMSKTLNESPASQKKNK
jgi:hypothetical protein